MQMRTIDRRLFLKMTGVVAAAGALPALAQVPARLVERGQTPLQPPGTYHITGRVRLDAPQVKISGITNSQQISWTPGSLSTPVASFSSFEHFDQPWRMPEIQVSGGTLESIQVVPLLFG
jgi:hypothetical protein